MINSKSCMGCGACVSVCPKQCISLKKGDIGLERIYIDKKLCIGCNLCNQVCQLEHPIELQKILNLYIIAPNKVETNICSTSAGAAYEISKHFLLNGGVVIGVGWDKAGQAAYLIARNEAALKQFSGSKYVYPKTNDIYKKALEIRTNERVLFIGLPCHIAALKTVCKNDMHNIFTIDLLCHGAPQPSFLEDHLANMGISMTDAAISFRQGEKYILTAKTTDKIYSKEFQNDLYLYGFLNGLIQKEFCYSCPYAFKDRVGDLTLGDAWGQKIFVGKRTNLVGVNSVQGKRMLELIQSDFELVQLDAESFLKNGTQMKSAVKKHSGRDHFEFKLKKKGFEAAAWDVLQGEMTRLRLRRHLSKIKRTFIK